MTNANGKSDGVLSRVRRFSAIEAAAGGMMLALSLAWKDALTALVDHILPEQAYGPLSAFVAAVATTILCILISIFLTSCVDVIETISSVQAVELNVHDTKLQLAARGESPVEPSSASRAARGAAHPPARGSGHKQLVPFR